MRYETLNEENKALKFEISKLTEHLDKVRLENTALRVLYLPLTENFIYLYVSFLAMFCLGERSSRVSNNMHKTSCTIGCLMIGFTKVIKNCGLTIKFLAWQM